MRSWDLWPVRGGGRIVDPVVEEHDIGASSRLQLPIEEDDFLSGDEAALAEVLHGGVDAPVVQVLREKAGYGLVVGSYFAPDGRAAEHPDGEGVGSVGVVGGDPEALDVDVHEFATVEAPVPYRVGFVDDAFGSGEFAEEHGGVVVRAVVGCGELPIVDGCGRAVEGGRVEESAVDGGGRSAEQIDCDEEDDGYSEDGCGSLDSLGHESRGRQVPIDGNRR